MPSQYEIEKAANIRKNRELLESLGLDKPLFEPKAERHPKPKPQTKKRKAVEPPTEDSDEPAAKAPRGESTATPTTGLRRSSRTAGKTLDYSKEIIRPEPKSLALVAGIKHSENDGPMGREDGKRKHNPKTYGSIPGIEVGTWWETRKGCSTDAIHAPWVGGIHGGKDGAYSVALSGGYDDDVDFGYSFTYTGSGGRDLKGTKDAPKNLRTAPQSSNQSWDNTFNEMLRRSSETRKPVRVVRGFKLRSKYAPYEGYRYDGLYVVEKAWIDKGNNPKGYLVCKFAFKRLPNQPPLPVRDSDDADADEQPQSADEEDSNEKEEDES